MSKTLIDITRLNDLNTLVIKRRGDHGFFLTTSNSLIISISNLSYLLKFLVMNKLMSAKVLEGILEEYYGLQEEGL